MISYTRQCVVAIVLVMGLLMRWETSHLPLVAMEPQLKDVDKTTVLLNASDCLPTKMTPSLQTDDSRPRNLQLVFIGDSITRYQYLSLAYFLRYGRWWDSPHDSPNNLFNAHSFRHPAHPSEDWNEFFLQSNRMLYPMEACDCVRSMDGEIVCERRYFHDPERNNTMVYINMNGNETHGSWGYYGNFAAQEIFANFEHMVEMPVGFRLQSELVSKHTSTKESRFSWEYATWGDVLRYHVGELGLGHDCAVVLNAGLHPHNFGGNDTESSALRSDLVDALQSIQMQSIWKTTSYTLHEIRKSHHDATVVSPKVADVNMCELLGHCLNISWTIQLRTELYFDHLHFFEPVYRVLNEDLLTTLGFFTENYQPFDRSILLRRSTHRKSRRNLRD